MEGEAAEKVVRKKWQSAKGSIMSIYDFEIQNAKGGNDFSFFV